MGVLVALLLAVVLQPPPISHILREDLRWRHLIDQDDGQLVGRELYGVVLDDLPPQLKEVEDAIVAERLKDRDCLMSVKQS